jgi:hypothetical protein
MFRLLSLSLSIAIIFLGFVSPFLIKGYFGYLVALVIILIGGFVLWKVEQKTIHKLEENTALNKILNTNDGPE